jgi:hypothetical protein
MEPVAQWLGLALQPSELNPASFECPCRQTVRSKESHRGAVDAGAEEWAKLTSKTAKPIAAPAPVR